MRDDVFNFFFFVDPTANFSSPSFSSAGRKTTFQQKFSVLLQFFPLLAANKAASILHYATSFCLCYNTSYFCVVVHCISAKSFSTEGLKKNQWTVRFHMKVGARSHFRSLISGLPVRFRFRSRQPRRPPEGRLPRRRRNSFI